MSIPDSLKTVLVKCVSCTLHCDGIHLDPECGIIPRGFGFGSGTIQDKELMVIFPEPANNDNNRCETTRYHRAKQRGGWESLADGVDRVTTEYFKYGRSDFHCRIMGLLIEVFQSWSEVFRRCYFTKLTKCQKPECNSSVPDDTRQKCFDLYLCNEVEIVQPSVALLLGKNVEKYRPKIDRIMKVQGRTVLAQHPSYSRPKWMHEKEDRARVIGELRKLFDLL